MTTPHVTWSLDELPGASIPRAVTIGKFDGVHLGHQRVLQSLAEMAAGAELTVVTFDRHPRATLDPESAPEALVSIRQKVELLGNAGVNRVAVIPFTHEFADVSHEDFVRQILVEGLGVAAVLVGRDFRYGHAGAGSLQTLTDAGQAYGFAVNTCQDVVEDGGQRVSSTRIRSLLREGAVAEAAGLLGRRHVLRSTVVGGHTRGRDLGWPTANLANPLEGMIPADGVYATLAGVGGELLPAMTSIGVNPTFDDIHGRVVETHVFDFSDSLYDQEMSVEFVEYVRPMQKFSDANELAIQMGRDADHIRQVLAL